MKAARRQHRSASSPAKFLTRRVRSLFVSALILVSLTIAALYLISPRPVEAVSTSIVISQVYGGGGSSSSSGTYKCDYIELYNRGTSTQDLSTWSVQYDPAGSTSGSYSKTNLSGSLAPGRYYLIKESCSTTNPTGLDLSGAATTTGTFDLSGTAGKVALVNNQTALTTSSGGCPTSTANIVDFVGYGTTANCREGTTTADNAPAPSTTTADVRKNGGNQDTDNNATDFSTATPTPRSGVFNASSSIAPDASSHACQFYDLLTGPTLSWQHTIGSGSNRLLMVGISTYTTTADPAARVLSVTYNGTPLTRVDDTQARDTGNQTQVEMFRLLESQMPAAGTYTITATLTIPNATSTYAVGGAVSFSGVDQTTPFNTGQTSSLNNTFAEAKGSSTTPTVTVASGSNEYVMDTVSSVYTGAGSAILSANNPLQMEQWNGANCISTVQDSIGAGSTRPGASPNVTMQWSLNSSNPWAIGAVSIRPASTLVKLSDFNATQTKSGVMLNWRTGYEVNNLGFNLYRERNGERVQVNPSIIAGSAMLIGQGGSLNAGDSYRWFDPQGTSDSVYYLEDVDLGGARKLHGPVAPAKSTAADINASQKQAMLLSQLTAPATTSSGISQWQTSWPALTGEPRELNYKTNAKQGNDLATLIAENGAVKISVNHEGWYRVTQADLAGVGFKPKVDTRMLQLYEGDAQIPILMNAATAQFSPGDSFEFYGRGLDTPTTDTNTYWLVIGDSKGLRIAPATKDSKAIKSPVSMRQPSQIKGTSGQGVEQPPSSVVSTQNGRPFWLILPIIISPEPKSGEVKPKTDAETAKNNSNSKDESNSGAASTKPSVRNDSENSSAPTKKIKKKKARARKASLKASSRNHPMLLRPVAAQSYPYTVQLKERLIYVASIINGETENFYGQVISSNAATENLVLENVDQTSGGAAQLEIALQGYTLTNHQVQVAVNGQTVGTMNLLNQEYSVVELPVPSTLLHEGQNTVTLTRTGGSTDVSLVDYVRLTYEHSYHTDGNILRFTADGSTRIDGFTNSNISVVDISDPRRVRELNCLIESTAQGYAVTVQAQRNGEYIAFTDDQIQRPAAIELDQSSNLRSSDNRADLVVISYGDFLSSVKPLVDLRRSEGLAVSLVDVQDVYDEFSHGAHTPYAIKDFLLWTSQHWQKSPQFVLLVGDASIDPRNYLGGGMTDFVPTKLIDSASLETASDDWLADFNNDGLAEMAVGRLPVRTQAEAALAISKIVNYSPNNALQQVLMVEDRNNAGDSFNFATAGEQLGALLPAGMSLNTINRANSNDDTTLHNQIISAINQGPLMVNYIGHGSVEVWTGAPLLSTSDVAVLNNSNHLSVFVMMTCLNGYFPNPTRESLAEALLRDNANGAVAVWASSGMTEPSAQAQVNQELYQQIFNQTGMTLGTAVQKAKQKTDESDVRRTWILFGDPTLRLR